MENRVESDLIEEIEALERDLQQYCESVETSEMKLREAKNRVSFFEGQRDERAARLKQCHVELRTAQFHLELLKTRRRVETLEKELNLD